jgi:hypothetical protein
MIKTLILGMVTSTFTVNSYYFDKPSDIINWSENYKLKYTDFKGVQKKDKNKPQGEIAINISWTAKIEKDIPKYVISNKFDKSKSWLTINHSELIKEYQFIWNLQELYIRKARKQISDLNNLNESNEDLYLNVIKSNIKKFQKEKNRYSGILQNQPDFYRILDKKYQDSINLYANYKQ